MKRYNIVFLDCAIEELKLIYNYCNNIIGSNYANKVAIKILQSIYSLDIFPNSNPIYYIQNNIVIRKKIVNKRYIIIFRVISNSVFIYNILDGRRNLNPAEISKKI